MVADPAMTYLHDSADVVSRGHYVAQGHMADSAGRPTQVRCIPAATRDTVDAKTWKTTYIQRWSLDVQRELGKAVVATLGYVGSRGTHLPIQYDLNLPAQGTYLNSGDFHAARPLSAVSPGRWEALKYRPLESQQQLSRHECGIENPWLARLDEPGFLHLVEANG